MKTPHPTSDPAGFPAESLTPSVDDGGPWYRTGRSLSQGEAYCTCCERDLYSDNRAVRMLELDQRTDTYHDLGGVPADRSQGWFPFGLACARKKLKEHEAKLAARKGGARV